MSRDSKQGVQQQASGLLYTLIYVFALIMAGMLYVGWPFAVAYRYLVGKYKSTHDPAIAFLAFLVIFPFISFWGVVAIDKYDLINKMAPRDKYMLILLPKLPRMANKLQKQVSSLLSGNLLDTRRPYRLGWLIVSNPFVQAGFLYFTFRVRNRFEKQLDRYSLAKPVKVNFEKIHKKASKQARKQGYGFTFLGYNYKHHEPAVITDEERYRHVQIIGGTGSGKTSSVIFPMMAQDMERGRGIVFVDAKGDVNTAKTIYRMAEERGRADDFMMFSMSFPEKSNTYNPLALGNATQLKDKVIGAISFTEPHYKRECESGLQTLFHEMLRGGKKVTLKTLNDILRKPSDEFPEFALFSDEHEKNISGIQNEINLMVNTPFSHLFEGEEINLLDVYNHGKIVYFALNILTYGETGKRLGRLITGDLNTLCGMAQNLENRNGLAVFIDEYGAFGTEPFAIGLSQGRSAKFMVTIAHQSSADLAAVSPHHAGQVKANTKTQIILQSNYTDGEEFCKEVGTFREIEVTRQVALDGQLSGAQMGSEKVVDLYCINPQELRQLSPGLAAYKTPSEYGLVQLKYFGYPKEVLRGISLPERGRVQESLAEVMETHESEAGRNPVNIFNI